MILEKERNHGINDIPFRYTPAIEIAKKLPFLSSTLIFDTPLDYAPATVGEDNS
jgi:hypothetical protein